MYTLTLDQDLVPFTNYKSAQGRNLNASDNAIDVIPIKRNITTIIKSYLVTCNLYWKDKPLLLGIKIMEYSHGKK
jgi:hypothetical protein